MQITPRLGHQIFVSPKRPANYGSECDVKIAVPLRNESDISQLFWASLISVWLLIGEILTTA
jgi:hypothetical protein